MNRRLYGEWGVILALPIFGVGFQLAGHAIEAALFVLANEG
jgi:hypothetical protein